MTLDAHSAEFCADTDFAVEDAVIRAPAFPRHDDVADPQAGWAFRNPNRAMAFLFVSPRDCAAIDELMAL
jgi:hypothetical protein